MYTPTYTGHTHFYKVYCMSTTINSIIATTFKQVLPVCTCNSTGRSEISRLSENGNVAIFATTSGVYPKISLLPVLSQINTIAPFF